MAKEFTSLGDQAVPEILYYNPRSIIQMTTDSDFFKSQLPPILDKCAASSNLVGPKTQVTWVLSYIKEKSSNVIEQGQKRMFSVIYGNFCRSNKFTKYLDQGTFAGLEVVKPLEELDENERKLWEQYLKVAEIERDEGLKVLETGILYLLDLPDVRYTALPPDVRSIYEAYQKAPYELVSRLFPDLTDVEAKKLFGQLTSADKVHEMATGFEIVTLRTLEDDKPLLAQK